MSGFEKDCSSFFDVKHVITVNSWTSGLVTAVGALDINPGDEIIVSPWTMCASATAILHWNAIPVFADIDPVTYCLDPASVRKSITDKTKAILSVDIGGHPADTFTLNKIAKEYGLRLYLIVLKPLEHYLVENMLEPLRILEVIALTIINIFIPVKEESLSLMMTNLRYVCS